MDPNRLRLPPPHPGSTPSRSYRPPRAVHYEAEEEDGFWNVTSSEGEHPHREVVAPGRRRLSTRETIVETKSASRPSRRRPTQHHRRDPPLELAYHDEEYPEPSMSTSRDRPPRPGGDVFQPDPVYANPFAPRPGPQPTRPLYERKHEQYPSMSPPYGGPPPFYQPPPVDPYFSGQGGYPVDPPGGGYFGPQPPHPNIYPGVPGPSGPSPYAYAPPLGPIYDELPPHRDEHLVEMERLERKARKLEIRERDLKLRQREEEAARKRREAAEKAERRERRRIKEPEDLRKTEILGRRDLEARRDIEPRAFPKRQHVEPEVTDEDLREKIAKAVKGAMEQIAASAQKDENLDDDIEDMVVQIMEQRLQRQERLGIEERSMKSARSAKSTGTTRTARKLEIVPYEQEVDLVTRTQIETIVIDVLKRLGMAAPAEPSPSIWDNPAFTAFGRPTPIQTSSREYDARFGEVEARPGPGHHDSHEKSPLNPRTPDSQGRFSDRTAVDTSDRYHPIELDRGTVRLKNPPGPRKEAERRRDSNTSALRTRTSAPRNEYFTEIHDQSAEEEYRPSPKRREKNDAAGNGVSRKRPEKEQKRKKRRETAPPDSDETDETYTRRQEGQYAIKPPRGSRRDYVNLPTVPDAPQGDPNSAHKATVVTDADED